MMKRHLLAAAVVLLSCGGCVGYYSDPYTYYPYSSYSSYYPYYRSTPYRPYYPYYSYPAYRPPAVYYAPGWSVFYPSLYFGYRHHHYRGPYYHRAPYYRGGPYYHRGGGRR